MIGRPGRKGILTSVVALLAVGVAAGGPPPKRQETPQQADVGGRRRAHDREPAPGATPEPGTADDGTRNGADRSPNTFVPREKIPEDSPVSFPADI